MSALGEQEVWRGAASSAGAWYLPQGIHFIVKWILCLQEEWVQIGCGHWKLELSGVTQIGRSVRAWKVSWAEP